MKTVTDEYSSHLRKIKRNVGTNKVVVKVCFDVGSMACERNPRNQRHSLESAVKTRCWLAECGGFADLLVGLCLEIQARESRS